MIPPRPRLLAIDGNSIGHRAWHALQRSPLAGSGVEIAHGSGQMIASVCGHHGPFDAILIAFDTRDNFRKAKYPEYKAGRAPRDPALYQQLDELQPLLRTAGLTVMTAPGYEADDLLASAGHQGELAGWDVTIFTSDRDLTQCVTPHVTLLRPGNGTDNATPYTPAKVMSEYGVRPDQYLLFAALRGDPSDNLPGVSGVGPKKAAALIAEHPDADALLDGIKDIPKKLGENLRAGKDNIVRNLDMMAPVRTLPIDFMSLAETGIDADRVVQTYRDANLPDVAAKFSNYLNKPTQPEAAPSPEVEPGMDIVDPWQSELENMAPTGDPFDDRDGEAMQPAIPW